MISGSDAHGTPVMILAEKEARSCKETLKDYHGRFLKNLKDLEISFDLFTHTDTANHHRLSQEMIARLFENGFLSPRSQKQLFSQSKNRFLPDRLVEGTCPNCGHDKARGDQCDSCGKLLDAIELKDPRSRLDGDIPVIKESEHLYFDLPKLQKKLLEYLSPKEKFWRHNVWAESMKFAEELQARAFTRDLDWGIKTGIKGFEEKCIYVWYEALLGYLTAPYELSKMLGQPDLWRDFWSGNNCQIYNFIGKDNVLFHTIIWPAMLIALDKSLPSMGTPEKLNLPYDTPANQFLNLSGQKFSKSLGVILNICDLLPLYGTDSLRFYLTYNMPEHKDSEWNTDDLIAKSDSELLAKWGNLIQRVLSFAWKNFDGAVPEAGDLQTADYELLNRVEKAFENVGTNFANCSFRAALMEILELVSEVNRYIDSQAPWRTIKDNRKRAASQIAVAACAIDSLATLLAPITPTLSEKVRALLGAKEPLVPTPTIQESPLKEEEHQILLLNRPIETSADLWKPSNLLGGVKLTKEPEALVRKLASPQ